mgnify:CR=1 FL=1
MSMEACGEEKNPMGNLEKNRVSLTDLLLLPAAGFHAGELGKSGWGMGI